jgi:predicted nucleic-acid-binding protein
MACEALAIDANVILRYLVRDDKALWEKADAVMRRMDRGEVVLDCDPVILGEVVWTLTSFYKLPRERIASALLGLLSAEGFRVLGKDRYVRALQLYSTSVPHFADACASAAAIEDCDGQLLSFDRALSRVEGVSRHEELSAANEHDSTGADG